MAATPAQMQQINNILDTIILPSLGWQLDIPQWAIQDMAGQGLTTAFDIGQYLAGHVGTDGAHFVKPDFLTNMPWMAYGMNAASYNQSLLSLNATWTQMTGQTKVPDQILSQTLSQYKGQIAGAQFRDFLMTLDNIKNTYGWLRYGLDYQAFQQQKLQMRSQFGEQLTDQQAVVQLQYLHTAQGSNQSASAQPTFSQVEKRQAEVGVGQSEVR